MKWRSIYVNWLEILMLHERSSGTEWRKSVLMSCFIPNLAWWSDWTIRGSLINSSVAATFYWFGIDRVINARFNTMYRKTVWGLGGTGLLLDHQASLFVSHPGGLCLQPSVGDWISTATNHVRWWWVLPSVSTSVHICEVTTDQFHITNNQRASQGIIPPGLIQHNRSPKLSKDSATWSQ